MVRAVGLAAVLGVGAERAWRATAADRRVALSPGAGLADVITAAAGVALCLALLWALVIVLAVVTEPVTGRRLAASLGCPRALHRLLVLACGVAVAGTLAGTANAAAGPHDGSRDDSTSIAARLDGLPLPDRPVGTDALVDRTHRVVAGECLWRIAAARLGPDASVGEIDRAWRAIYRANRDRIGADPDLIRPGLRLDLTADSQEER